MTAIHMGNCLRLLMHCDRIERDEYQKACSCVKRDYRNTTSLPQNTIHRKCDQTQDIIFVGKLEYDSSSVSP
jgi:hypothetical protein